MIRLLLIRFSALGDVAMLVPVVREAAEQNSDVEITVLSRERFAPLFAGLPENVRFAGADLSGRHKGINGLCRLLEDIGFRQFDYVADLHNVLRSRFLDLRFRLAGKRVAVIGKARFSKWWLTCPFNSHRHPLLPMQERYRRLLGRFMLPESEAHRDFIGTSLGLPDTLEIGKGIGIAPFAAHTGKIYPLDKMERVVALLSVALAERGTIYLFGGGAKEEALLHTWETRYDNVVSVAGKMTLTEELELMRKLKLMLTMDSANMHLASLVGTRVISIWGATHPMAGFLGAGQSEADCIQHDMPCRPCSVYGSKACRLGDYRCLDIAPEQVVEKVLSAYSGGK